MRISGIEIPDQKKVDIALRYIYGIGKNNVYDILKEAKVDSTKRASALSEEELKRLQKAIEEYKTEGDLRSEITDNIKRLKDIGSYRGLRHNKNLPVRGQRTRSNARTKRGKRVTIGAIKKDVAVKMGLVEKDS